MLVFLLPAARREYIKEAFDFLYNGLGATSYGRLFLVILMDNGSAFKDPRIFEREMRTERVCIYTTVSHGLLAKRKIRKES